MNTKLFSEAINEVDDRYYEEAGCYESKRKTPGRVKWGAAAACFAVISAAVFSFLPILKNQQGITPPDGPNGIITDHPNDTIPPAASEIHISMGDISLNEITELSDTGLRWYDPQLYDEVVWDKESVINYYGKDLTPVYIPDGLTGAPGNGTSKVVIGKDGNIERDTVRLGFYHDYYEDGSQKLTEDAAACKGFSIAVSKVGLLNECLYIMPEDEVKSSDIGGIKVIFGYRSMPYGPYDPETHEPSGYYDMYAAEFKKDGMEYQIIAEQMEAEELVKVVSSVIYEKEVIIDE